jgi:hypothetical protein
VQATNAPPPRGVPEELEIALLGLGNLDDERRGRPEELLGLIATAELSRRR